MTPWYQQDKDSDWVERKLKVDSSSSEERFALAKVADKPRVGSPPRKHKKDKKEKKSKKKGKEAKGKKKKDKRKHEERKLQ